MERRALEDLVTGFTDAFNRDDLDGMLSFFADDGVYVEFNGRRHEGRAAIREAFAAQFRGDFGAVRFHEEDLFVDPEAGKATIRWTCSLDSPGRSGAWQGLDVIHVRDGRISEKLTYARAEKPLMSKPGA